MQDEHLSKSPAIEVYGHCKLLLPWLMAPYVDFLAIWGWKIEGMTGD